MHKDASGRCDCCRLTVCGRGPESNTGSFLYAFLRTALSEEILFRGFVLKAIKNKAGFYAGNTVQALIFGLLHGIPFGLVTKSILALVLLHCFPVSLNGIRAG